MACAITITHIDITMIIICTSTHEVDFGQPQTETRFGSLSPDSIIPSLPEPLSLNGSRVALLTRPFTAHLLTQINPQETRKITRIAARMPKQ